jgi:hypothetical protein
MFELFKQGFRIILPTRVIGCLCMPPTLMKDSALRIFPP